MAGIADEIKASFLRGTATVKLIYINLAVFVLIGLVRVIHFLFNSVPGEFDGLLTWLMVPASLERLMFKPWTLITYMFLHAGFLHILFNMIWLFWFGRIFQKYLTDKQLYTTYLLGGIAGAALFIISYNVFPGLRANVSLAEALGASASVTAIVIAISFFAPNYTVYLPFIGPVKIKYIAIIFLAMDVLRIASSNAGGHIAHLGGALYGYLFALQLKRGKDIGKGFSSFADGVASLFRRKPNMKVTYKRQARNLDDFEYNKRKIESQKEIDRILDKIAQSGYDSLSKKEKETLFKMSNKS